MSKRDPTQHHLHSGRVKSIPLMRKMLQLGVLKMSKARVSEYNCNNTSVAVICKTDDTQL